MSSNYSVCTTSEVFQHIRENDAHIIDIRTIDCYNGWRWHGEKRGGHIKSARSVPYKWFSNQSWPTMIKSKGITPDKHLVLYGYESDLTEKAAAILISAGFRVSVYNDFTCQWCNNPELPMSRMERYHSLVPSWWLKDIITQGTALEFENKKVVLCHTYYHDKNAYDKGHIAHAIAIDTELFETPQTWNRRSPSELRHSLEQSGITADTTVILYGRDIVSDGTESHPGANAGHLSAMRVAFIMLYAGVNDVRILNGGLQSWVDEGYSLSLQPCQNQPVSDFGAHVPLHPELMVDIKDVQSFLKVKNRELVCVCSRPEFEGRRSGYNYIEKKGHIPGSVLIENGSDAYHMESYRNPDQTTREYHEIERLWLDHGLLPEKKTVFYCGTGWRASEACINAWLIGWHNSAVYDGGWLEWSRMVS